MKNTIFFFISLFSFLFSMTIYAGQWKQDATGWKYQNDDGSYKTGWYRDVDEKWYYFDNQSGYMLVDTATPDGFKLGKDGVWLEMQSAGENTTDGYQMNIEIKMSAFRYPGGIDTLEKEIPVKIHYNETYDNLFTGKIHIDGFDVTKEGVAYVKLSLDTVDIGELKVKGKYYLKNGSVEELEWNLRGNFEEAGEVITTKLFKLSETSLVSAEIWIDNAK